MNKRQKRSFGWEKEAGEKVTRDSGRAGDQLGTCWGALGMGGKVDRARWWGLEGGAEGLGSELAPLFRDLATLRCHRDRPPGSLFADKLVS